MRLRNTLKSLTVKVNYGY